jgi:hypothetical protein
LTGIGATGRDFTEVQNLRRLVGGRPSCDDAGTEGGTIGRDLKYDASAGLALLTLVALCPIPLAILPLGLLLVVAATSPAPRRTPVAARARPGR